MEWCWALPVVWLIASSVVNGGKLPSQKEVPVDLQITKLQIVDDNNYEVQFTKGATDITTVNGYNLVVVPAGADQRNVYSNVVSNIGDNYAVSFADKLNDLSGVVADFVLNAGVGPSVVTGGTTTFDTFPALPNGVVMSLASYEETTVSEIETKATKYILRVYATTFGDLTEIEPKPSDGISVSNSNTQYHLEFSDVDSAYSLCNANNDVIVCDKAMSVTAAPLTKDLTMVESATLRYSSADKSEAEIEVILVSGGDSNSLDAIILDSEALCTSSGLTTKCDKSTFTLGTDTSMFVVGLENTGNMLEYADFTISDYHVIGQEITSTTLEVRWDFQESVTQYKITRAPTDGGTFAEAIVNCDPGVSGMTVPCFGYFTGLATGTPYRITVQPGTGDATLDNLNIIESEPIPVNFKYSGMQIRLHQLSWRQNGGILDAKVCFNHISHNKETVFSHYEFVLINKEGQWLKQKLMTQYIEGDLCFTPFIIHTETFDVAEGATLIVTQRAIDGFTLLASGETQVTFSLNQ